MGGFECTDKLNAFGHRVDFLPLTGHLAELESDYQNLGLFGIRTVREGIRWAHIERAPYVYDWSVVVRMIETAQALGIQQLWDICHFGFPDDLTPLHPLFPARFAAVCRAFVRLYRSIDPTGPLVITPINEVSFLSWLGGQVRGTSPYCVNLGWEVKYRLMKACIEGVEAMKAEDPTVRILMTEPLVNIIARPGSTAKAQLEAKAQNDLQFQVLDLLSGRICPELRGRPDYVDLIGLNFYYNNQWLADSHEFIRWRSNDPRWMPLSQLLQQVHRRYGRPLVLSETSHPKEDRPVWVEMLTEECLAATDMRLPLLGVCWYPIIDRPDWDDLVTWHEAGLWDRGPAPGGAYRRVLHQPTARALLRAQAALSINTVMEPLVSVR